MQPEIDYVKIGQRIKAARLERGYSQAELGALVGCSNNHMSHVEVGQTKVSLPMLLKLSLVLEKSFDYFLLDTPYAKCESIINNEIADKLNQCSAATLVTVSKILDALIDQQKCCWQKTECKCLIIPHPQKTGASTEVLNLYRFTRFLDSPSGLIFVNLLVGAASPIPFERYLRYRLLVHHECSLRIE